MYVGEGGRKGLGKKVCGMYAKLIRVNRPDRLRVGRLVENGEKRRAGANIFVITSNEKRKKKRVQKSVVVARSFNYNGLDFLPSNQPAFLLYSTYACLPCLAFPFPAYLPHLPCLGSAEEEEGVGGE